MKRYVMWGAILVSFAARAETKEIRCAQQYGLSYLPLMMMEDGHLVEKHAQRLGLGEVKATWAKLGGPGAMNDALLSGGLDFGTGGVPSLITLWAKTKGSGLEVRGVGALNDMPVELIVANPKIKSIKDFGPQDKIAVTTVKISTQALLLEMAAAKEWGDESYEKLDSLTVSMPHPDALTALLSGSGITAHFSSPPFEYQEKAKGMRAITSNYDILGGKATFNVVWSTRKFHDQNPKAYAAFVAAFQEATDLINKDRKAAAETYKRMSRTAESIDELLKEIKDPQVEFTLTPHKTLVTAQFMHKIGRIKIKPAKWDDLYFQNLHGRPGS
ncbi:MAG: ABC transporter substrate-binding protein [Deltaproteobacteria bacterium]|nr:MAG: ABC transporter substrate-binding protein [Deltaproteobacteria bacterium]